MTTTTYLDHLEKLCEGAEPNNGQDMATYIRATADLVKESRNTLPRLISALRLSLEALEKVMDNHPNPSVASETLAEVALAAIKKELAG